MAESLFDKIASKQETASAASYFTDQARKRQQQQDNVKRKLVSEADTDKRTTLTLALSQQDKQSLRILAMEEGKTMAGMVHAWIQRAWEEREKS